MSLTRTPDGLQADPTTPVEPWTAGPWRVDEAASGPLEWRVYGNVDGGEVCRVMLCSVAGTNQDHANARLIAAAPELVAAVDEAEEALGNNLVWLTDALDLRVRQGDKETLRRLQTLTDAWTRLAKAAALARIGGKVAS